MAPSALSASIFVTGGSGFIGRRFLAELRARGFERVTCLSRTPPAGPAGLPGWSHREGDLASPASYADLLAQADIVVHLAAATGNASPADLTRINVDATGRLLGECERQGVNRILYISSIAAGYPDLSGYPYGRSKRQAEELVRAGRMDYTILRPTIVLGPGSPVWQRLRAMATLPLPVVLGNGRARVQPVDVQDVVRGMAMLVERSRFSGEILELGGPEELSFEQLIRRIRAAHGKSQTPLVKVPMAPLRLSLVAAGRLLGSRFPVGPGQLVPFTQDGVASPNDLALALRPGMPPLDTLLKSLVHAR